MSTVLTLSVLANTQDLRHEECRVVACGVLEAAASDYVRCYGEKRFDREELVNEAFKSLQNRLERENRGALGADQKRYGDLPVNSPDFGRIAWTFIKNVACSLARKEGRHNKGRESADQLSGVAAKGDVSGHLELYEEFEQALRTADCSDRECEILRTLYEHHFDKNTAAKTLGISVAAIDKTISRVRARLRTLDT